jgi:DNA-binding transcriptional LysR family regulator
VAKQQGQCGIPSLSLRLCRRHEGCYHPAHAIRFVGLSAGSPLQDFLGDKAARAGQPCSFRVRTPTFEGICQMVAQDVGIGIVPHTAAVRWRRSMAIQSIKLTDAWATRRLSLGMLQLEALTPHARELVRHLAGSGLVRPWDGFRIR